MSQIGGIQYTAHGAQIPPPFFMLILGWVKLRLSLPRMFMVYLGHNRVRALCRVELKKNEKKKIREG